jgi:predicted transcriptional regulator
MSDNTQPMPLLNAGQPQTLTIKEAAAAYGVSADTIRRAIKREQKKKGSGLAHEQRKSDKGVEYVLTSTALEAFGYLRIETRSRVQVATVDLQAETMRAEITELRAKLEVQTIRAEYAAKEAERLKEEAERATENLRIALTRIPAALPPGKPSLISRLFNKSKTEEKPTA